MDISAISLWASLSVWLAGIWVALGQSGLARTAIEMIGKSPRLSGTMLIYTILGLALVETAIIYGLVVAFSIIGATDVGSSHLIGAGLVMGLTAFWAGYGEGRLLCAALEAVNRNPENKAQILQYMVLFAALVETSAIYGLIIAMKLLNA